MPLFIYKDRGVVAIVKHDNADLAAAKLNAKYYQMHYHHLGAKPTQMIEVNKSTENEVLILSELTSQQVMPVDQSRFNLHKPAKKSLDLSDF